MFRPIKSVVSLSQFWEIIFLAYWSTQNLIICEVVWDASFVSMILVAKFCHMFIIRHIHDSECPLLMCKIKLRSKPFFFLFLLRRYEKIINEIQPLFAFFKSNQWLEEKVTQKTDGKEVLGRQQLDSSLYVS